jgi:hypothetical protein
VEEKVLDGGRKLVTGTHSTTSIINTIHVIIFVAETMEGKDDAVVLFYRLGDYGDPRCFHVGLRRRLSKRHHRRQIFRFCRFFLQLLLSSLATNLDPLDSNNARVIEHEKDHVLPPSLQ